MLLEAEELTAGYGPVNVLHEVSLHLSTHEIVCIIGPNGAGKSTVLRAISGQILPRAGRIRFDDRDITQDGLRQKAMDGLIFIPQGENIFPNLTVLENLEIAGGLLQDKHRLRHGIEAVWQAFPVIREKRHDPARALSGGQRQLLALSRALMLSPKLALLDEPSLGLAPLVVNTIFEEIARMNRQGIAFLLVEQNARKGLSVSHRGYVLELGQNRLTGNGDELLKNPEVQRLYLGG